MFLIVQLRPNLNSTHSQILGLKILMNFVSLNSTVSYGHKKNMQNVIILRREEIPHLFEQAYDSLNNSKDDVTVL